MITLTVVVCSDSATEVLATFVEPLAKLTPPILDGQAEHTTSALQHVGPPPIFTGKGVTVTVDIAHQDSLDCHSTQSVRHSLLKSTSSQ